MLIIKALILGAVQGLAEFLPISSSGHLSLLSNLMGVDLDLSFMIMLHIGTILAVFIYFKREIKKCLSEIPGILFDAKSNLTGYAGYRGGPTGPEYRKVINSPYRKITLMLLVSMLPTVLLALIIHPVSEIFNKSLLVSGMGLFVTGLMLLIASLSERSGKGPKEARFKDALLVGLFQGIAAFPGVSRLAMTLSAGFFSGFTAKFNRLFSFLLFIPTMLGAVVLESFKNDWTAVSIGILPGIFGMLSAMAVGYFTISIAIKVLSKISIKNISVYCFIIGLVSVLFYLL